MTHKEVVHHKQMTILLYWKEVIQLRLLSSLTSYFLLMSVGLMSVGLMPVGLMPVGLMPVGLMPVGLMSVGLMPVGFFVFVCARVVLSIRTVFCNPPV